MIQKRFNFTIAILLIGLIAACTSTGGAVSVDTFNKKLAVSIATITGGAGAIALFKDPIGNVWTSSGTKGLNLGAQFTWTLD